MNISKMDETLCKNSKIYLDSSWWDFRRSICYTIYHRGEYGTGIVGDIFIECMKKRCFSVALMHILHETEKKYVFDYYNMPISLFMSDLL
jgi:hypothetical protein